ncbi:protein tyrosine phosphatase family protein [Methylobacterium sp. CM6244]
MSKPETLPPSPARLFPQRAFTPLSPSLSVTSQIDESALELAVRAGFRLVICNRPDGEEAGQLASTVLAQRAELLGIDFLSIPVRPGRFPEQAVVAFRKAVAGAGGPVLAYCRSGTRSASLAALATPDKTDPERSIRAIEAAGYDLSQVRAWLNRPEKEPGAIAGSGS